MGINGLLPRILPSAGRENYDLRSLSDGLIVASSSSVDHRDDGDERPKKRPRRTSSSSWTRRKVRIAVDVNGWIARAAHGYGGSLMDERHLSYHGRAELRNERLQQQQQQNQPQQDQQPPVEEEEGPTSNNNPLNSNELIQKQQRLEYITKCISFVLQRIEFLRNECCAMVLPVLDGATPPCKREAVRERSNRRQIAMEQRDEVAASPHRTVVANDANIVNIGEEEEENEATRTEAEVLRRISASKRAGTGKDYSMRQEMLGELLKEFRRRRWPFVVAPYEADGQLAYLANTGGVDLVVTEDSDLIALGVPMLIYRLGGWNGANAANRASGSGVNFGSGGYGAPASSSFASSGNLRGTMLCRRDLGSSHGINLMDFSDAMLATMFVAAGCDYCDSLKGIGIITARNIVKRAFHGAEAGESSGYSRSRRAPVLRVVLEELFHSCHKEAREKLLPLDDPTKEELRMAYERSFLAALAMFRHPLVYDPILGVHTISNDVCDGSEGISPASASFLRDEEILMQYEPYKELVTKKEMLYEVIGVPLKPEIAKGVAQGIIDPRQLPAEEPEESSVSGTVQQEGETAASHDNDHTQDEDEGVESSNLTQGSTTTGLQLSSQDFTAVGTQQSKSSSTASGMISSLSPDLLVASPSPQKQS